MKNAGVAVLGRAGGGSVPAAFWRAEGPGAGRAGHSTGTSGKDGAGSVGVGTLQSLQSSGSSVRTSPVPPHVWGKDLRGSPWK